MPRTPCGPPRHYTFSSTPVLPLYCTVRATPTPTNRFSPILPPGQDWSQNELLEAAVSSLQLRSERAPALLSILPVL